MDMFYCLLKPKFTEKLELGLHKWSQAKRARKVPLRVVKGEEGDFPSLGKTDL